MTIFGFPKIHERDFNSFNSISKICSDSIFYNIKDEDILCFNCIDSFYYGYDFSSRFIVLLCLLGHTMDFLELSNSLREYVFFCYVKLIIEYMNCYLCE